MNHRIGRAVFVVVFSAAVVWLSYAWITDPGPRQERAAQERAVMAARAALFDTTGLVDLELVDPLAPQRRVGKVYVFRNESGWEVSGYYRRDPEDSWHPWLMRMDADLNREMLKVQDDGLQQQAAAVDGFEVTPGARP